MVQEASSPEQIEEISAGIDRWLDDQLAENPIVAAVEREPSERRWFVRVHGEEKDTFTIWFQLGQRTLSYETYVMPGPEENREQFFEHLLRRNSEFFGAAFLIGDEEAVFLAGQIANPVIDDDELDRILGSLYAYVERCFRPALRIGFASRFGQSH